MLRCTFMEIKFSNTRQNAKEHSIASYNKDEINITKKPSKLEHARLYKIVRELHTNQTNEYSYMHSSRPATCMPQETNDF